MRWVIGLTILALVAVAPSGAATSESGHVLAGGTCQYLDPWSVGVGVDPVYCVKIVVDAAMVIVGGGA